MDTYSLDQLDHVAIERSATGTTLTVAPMAETAWYSPGLVVEDVEGQVHVAVVRCRLNARCAVTHPIDPADPPPWAVSLGQVAGDVYLKDEDGLHLLGP